MIRNLTLVGHFMPKLKRMSGRVYLLVRRIIYPPSRMYLTETHAVLHWHLLQSWVTDPHPDGHAHEIDYIDFRCELELASKPCKASEHHVPHHEDRFIQCTRTGVVIRWEAHRTHEVLQAGMRGQWWPHEYYRSGRRALGCMERIQREYQTLVRVDNGVEPLFVTKPDEPLPMVPSFKVRDGAA